MDNELKRSLILDNFSNPINKGLKNDSSYLKEDKNNSSCIDHFTIELKLNNNIIEDIRFDGEACAISTSATSIMINSLIGKNIEEVAIAQASPSNLISFIISSSIKTSTSKLSMHV